MTMTPVKQRGLSLISLMIALTIGVFLLAGLFTVWYQTRTTFKSQGQLTQLQDDERMALTIMANTVQTGGYYPVAVNFGASAPNPLLTQSSAFPATTPYTVAGQSIYGTHPASGGDTLEVRFMADANTLDCQGQSDTANKLVTNTFQIDANGNLTCSVVNNAGTQAAQTIVSGIASFTVQYGVATSGGASATEYMTADTVTTNKDWSNVRSVKLLLAFANPLAGQPGQPSTLPTISRLVAITQTSP